MADKKLNIKVRTKGAKKAKKELKGVEGGMKSLGKAAAIASAAFFGSKMLIEGLKKAIELGSKFTAVSKGFNSLARDAGFSANALDKLTKATDGTMNSIDLMTEANNAMLLGIVNSDDQMAQMFDTAQRLAEALGKDTAFGIQSIVTGLGRQSKLMLDNLGIMVDVEKANKDYAEALNKTTAELTDNERKQAFVSAAMTEANTLVNKLGSETTTAKKEMQKLNATMDAVAIEIGTDLEPALILGARAMNDFVEKTKGVDWAGMMDGMLVAMAAGTGPVSSLARKLIGELASVKAEQTAGGKSPKKIVEDVRTEFDKMSDAHKAAAQWSAQTASNLLTSAVMGDSIGEGLKRAVVQLAIMVAQAKAYAFFLNTATGGMGGILGGVASFLFGKSPTQSFPSPNGGGAKITINQNFGGMGVIDHNFAANSIIPAINKAISTGQARIG